MIHGTINHCRLVVRGRHVRVRFATRTRGPESTVPPLSVSAKALAPSKGTCAKTRHLWNAHVFQIDPHVMLQDVACSYILATEGSSSGPGMRAFRESGMFPICSSPIHICIPAPDFTGASW